LFSDKTQVKKVSPPISTTRTLSDYASLFAKISVINFFSSKKKGNFHKQDLHFSQEQLVQVTKFSDADMALFG
jgi:hypothetical protein